MGLLCDSLNLSFLKLVKTKICLVGILILTLSACQPNIPVPETPIPTLRSTSPTPTTTPLPVCTPPPCTVDEAYHCPDSCIGGCGTVCATHTPPPASEPDNQLVAVTATVTAEIQPEPTIFSVQTFPENSSFGWVPIVSGFTSPVGLAHADDDTGRLYIIEQPGIIRVVENAQVVTAPFLDIRDRVDDGSNEQGLLGLAFHPDFENNNFFYVNYTGKNGDTFISRFQVGADPNQADPNAELILLRIPQPFGNHNGGHLAFGPDGLLYIGTGDGGAANDPQGNAQNLNSLLGKMLRIDVNHGDPYAVPADNPYVNEAGMPQIWASGLRNPWRYTFDRATGDLYIGDVGQNQWEEISFLAANSPGGTNFGWDFEEGFHSFEGSPPENVPLIPPIWEYDHALGCSVTGGVVYRGSMSEWQGIYLYGDFCSGRVWGLLRAENGNWQNQELYQTGANITSFGEDQSGEVYLVDRKGTIFRLEAIP